MPARTALLVGLTLFLAADAVVLVPFVRTILLYALRRTSLCSFGAATHSPDSLSRRVLPHVRRIGQDGSYHRWQTPAGDFWVPIRSDRQVPWLAMEEMLDEYGPDLVRTGDVVIDCGANVGFFTRKALGRGARLVVAVEPAPDNAECLRKNFAEEVAFGRVIVYAKGVWDRDASMVLHMGNSSAEDSVVEGAGPGVQVPLTTIDAIARELKLDRVDVLKIDVEGSELRALQGGRETVLRWHPRITFDGEPVEPSALERAVRQMDSGYETRCGACLDLGSRVAPVTVSFYARPAQR
jgi:FkbM family methyltransferase